MNSGYVGVTTRKGKHTETMARPASSILVTCDNLRRGELDEIRVHTPEDGVLWVWRKA